MEDNDKIGLLKEYFQKQPDIAFALLFGSRAKNLSGSNSDWDIGVYFKPLSNQLEWEDATRDFPREDAVWSDLIKLLKTDNVDFVVLNRAPANIADISIRGIPLFVGDRTVFLEFILRITNEAESYREFVNEFFAINQRSASLCPEDKSILEKTIIFAQGEIKSYPSFEKMSLIDYRNDPDKRRSVERWIENIMNALIDMAKIILGSEKKSVPDTYREALGEAAGFLNIAPVSASNFQRWAKLRNILAHEYLDVKWGRIEEFIKESRPHIAIFVDAVKEFLSRQAGASGKG